MASPVTTTTEETLTAERLCQAVDGMVEDPEFQKKHSSKGAPLPIVAVAKTLVEKVSLPRNDISFYFDKLTHTVPSLRNCDSALSLDDWAADTAC